MSKYKVGDYIKVDVGQYETFGKDTMIEDVEIIEVDPSDDKRPYRVKYRDGGIFWVNTKIIVEKEEDMVGEDND